MDEIRICQTCGKEYSKPYSCSKIEWVNYYKFCSRKCKRHTEETKKKCSESRIGKTAKENHPQWQENSKRRSTETMFCSCGCGIEIKKYDYRGRVKKFANGHAIKGTTRNFTEDWKQNLSKSRKGKFAGNDHWNWQGGKTKPNHKIRTSTEYKEWRMKVFQRDHFACVECGYRSHKRRDIIADHIKPFFFFPELRLDVSNGRTLCKECDKKIAFNYERDKHLYVKTA